MDFLEEILGKELFAQLKEKLNAHNGEEANKYSVCCRNRFSELIAAIHI